MTKVPDEIRTILSSSLTERGMRQWWAAPNRVLSGGRPCDAWTDRRPTVVEAAQAFGEGYYV